MMMIKIQLQSTSVQLCKVVADLGVTVNAELTQEVHLAKTKFVKSELMLKLKSWAKLVHSQKMTHLDKF